MPSLDPLQNAYCKLKIVRGSHFFHFSDFFQIFKL